ncbi:MAG: hypothetical protein WBQ55_02530 [Xanthobacteraceae bacterium]
MDEKIRGYLYGCIVGPIKRAEKRAKRMEGRGYPAGYYDLPEREQRKVGARVRAKRSRDNKRGAIADAPVRPIPPMTISRALRDEMLARLRAWTAGTGRSACKFRGSEIALVKAAVVYHSLCATLHRQPSYTELAARIGCTRPAAQKRVAALTKLYSAAGPWKHFSIKT